MEGSDVVFLALGWYLIIEGFGPMVVPQRWRESVSRLSKLPDGALRLFGMVFVVLGLILVWSI